MRLKLLHRFLLICALALAAATVGAEEGYLTGIPDLPLMPVLQEVPDSGLIFDKPEGRIVQALASGTTTPEAVLAFYEESLPQLGWRREASGDYLREGERLRLEMEAVGDRVTVLFMLFPK